MEGLPSGLTDGLVDGRRLDIGLEGIRSLK